VAKKLLAAFDIHVYSYVERIGSVAAEIPPASPAELHRRAEASDVRCPDAAAAAAMRAAIEAARAEGDTLGGVFCVVATGVPPGLGSHVQWDRKLDGRLAQAVMSIQAVKGVEVGMGFRAAASPGSLVHDAIVYSADAPWGFAHAQNNAGGIEGGMSNGEAIVVRAAMKPIATLTKPLPSVDLLTRTPAEAAVERSDTCAVPAAAVVGEAAVAVTIAAALLEKCGGDSLDEVQRHFRGYVDGLR
jgi:chorismate synthase